MLWVIKAFIREHSEEELRRNLTAMMSSLEKHEDLTERSLTNLFRKYFQDENLNVDILGGDQKFLDANDNFSSDTRKLHLRITNAARFNNGLQREISIIVKASLNR